MEITLTDFRSQMFKIIPKIDNGEDIVIAYKKRRYVLLDESRARKIFLNEALKKLPQSNISGNEVRNAIENGRK